jgi:hypothetical protein
MGLFHAEQAGAVLHQRRIAGKRRFRRRQP